MKPTPNLADINQDGRVDNNDYLILTHGWYHLDDPE